MKLIKLLDCYSTCKIMISRKMKLPMDISLVLSRNIRKLSSVFEDYERQRLTLVDKYAKKDEKGNNIVNEKGLTDLTDDHAFNNEISVLLNTDIQMDFDLIPKSALENYDAEHFDPLELSQVMMFEELMMCE